MVPVVVLTGFLGSGKTTLLNRLFRERPPGRGRIAIVVNELGSVGIDGDLLPAGATRQVELPGGCICCQLVGELETAVAELIEGAPDLEHVIIETTGIADPLPISWTLAGDRLAPLARLAAVITVVDPFEHESSRALTPSVDAQVRYADLLVVSKLDQTPMPAELEQSLRARNVVAPIIAELPDSVAAALWTYLGDPAPRVAVTAGSDHGDAHTTGAHGLDSISIPADGVFDLEDLVAALEELPPGVVRLKGIVRAIDGESGERRPALYAVHRVGARVYTEPLSGTAEPRVVAIGSGLDPGRLSACLASAVVPS